MIIRGDQVQFIDPYKAYIPNRGLLFFQEPFKKFLVMLFVVWLDSEVSVHFGQEFWTKQKKNDILYLLTPYYMTGVKPSIPERDCPAVVY